MVAATSASIALLSPAQLWAIAGVVLCVLEIFLPTGFVILVMGISAFLVALVALAVPQWTILQIILWMILSVVLTIAAKRWLSPSSRTWRLPEKTEGETLSTIPAGKPGRVLLEGNSWRAICEDEQMEIPADEKVIILRREGNTLVVMPWKLLEED